MTRRSIPLYKITGTPRGSGRIILRHPMPHNEPQGCLVVIVRDRQNVAACWLPWGVLGRVLHMIDDPDQGRVLRLPDATMTARRVAGGFLQIAVTNCDTQAECVLDFDGQWRFEWAVERLMADAEIVPPCAVRANLYHMRRDAAAFLA